MNPWRKLHQHRNPRPDAYLHALARLLTAGVLLMFCSSANAQSETLVHGLWVWKGPSIIAPPGGVEKLRDFCQSEGIDEVYISVSSHGAMLQGDFGKLIETLHRSKVRVDALLSSETADEGGRYREKLLDNVREIVRFNQSHPKRRFDGIHLDIEPQQRPENKGPGNLRFLPGLVEAYKEVLRLAESAGLTVDADIQNKLLKGDLEQRRLLLSSLPRLTLMLYEVSSPNDGESDPQKAEKIQQTSRRFLKMAYEALPEGNRAKIVIGLRTPDYGALLPSMLKAVEAANSANPRYAGWARHSYNDSQSSQ
jgi:hypothetical protein